MTEHTSSGRRSPPPTWAVAAVSLLVGMLLMWVILKVDTDGIFGGTAGATTTDELARAAFDALKSEDFSKFTPFVIQRKDMEAMYRHVVKQGDSKRIKAADESIASDGGLDAMVLESTQKTRRGFLRAVLAAKEAKLDWRRAEYGGLDLKNTRLRDRYGVRSGRVDFFVLVDDARHTFRLRGCANPADVWVCGAGFEYRRAAEAVRGTPSTVQLPRESGLPRSRSDPAEPAAAEVVVPEQPKK